MSIQRPLIVLVALSALLGTGMALSGVVSVEKPDLGLVDEAPVKTGYDLLPPEEDGAPITPGPEKPGVTSSRYMDRDRNRVFDELDEPLATAADAASFPVIVAFNERPSDEAFEALRSELGGFSVKSNKENVDDPEGRLWDVLPAFSADLTKEQILRLAQREEIRHVELDGEVRAQMNTATVEGGVDKAVTDFGVNGDRTGALKTYTSADVVICVVDSGIRATHSDLNEGQVIAWRDEVNGQASPYDDNGHGTHVAGIAAGQGDWNSAYRGVAHGAALVGVKVLDSSGGGTETWIINGINWCNNNRVTYGIEIVTISIGTVATCTDGTDAMSTAVNNAWSNGLVVTVAMGNSGPGYCTVSSPGSAANVISVGRVSDPKNAACTGYMAGGWYLGQSSSRGATADGRVKPEISAPGTCITAPAHSSDTGYVTFTGTSMSTPFVAGVAALMLDANPALTNADIKSRLMSTSQDWGPDNQASEPQSYDYGAGRLQAYEAVKNACGCVGTGPSNPSHYFGAEDLAGAGSKDKWSLPVTTTSWRIALTLIIPSASGTKDFDLRLYNPSGTQVATSLGTTRQETISYVPTVTGTYTIQVESYAGSGSYWLDASAGASSMSLTQDQ